MQKIVCAEINMINRHYANLYLSKYTGLLPKQGLHRKNCAKST